MGTIKNEWQEVGDLVDLVAKEALVLPEIQRDYVWTRPQVRDLLDSLYRGYPIGTMLIWESHDQHVKKSIGGTSESDPPAGYILDGQQRLTSLYRLIHTDSIVVRFNVETEEFQVSNAVHAKNPLMVSVANVIRHGTFETMVEYGFDKRPDMKVVGKRLQRLEHIFREKVPVNVLKGFDYDEVTDIFVRVNSKGTRLRVAELAIAQLAFRLPGMVTSDLKAFEDDLEGRGWDIDIRLMLRCLTAVATKRSSFKALNQVPTDELKEYWKQTKAGIETFLSLLKANLGLESLDWISSTTAMVGPVAYIAWTKQTDRNVDAMLHWFLLGTTWGRYSQASETALDQDLATLANTAVNPFPALVERVRQVSGRLNVVASDLDDAGVKSPYFLVAYLACRQAGAIDWWSGIKLNSTNLGTSHLLELHHIFPKALVSPHFTHKDVNELANIAFLGKSANASIGKKEPREYLKDIAPERLQRQFIPMNTDLWEVSRFLDFIAERRTLLASAMNGVFASLGAAVDTVSV